MHDPGAQHYITKFPRGKLGYELWRWRVSDLWDAAKDLPVREESSRDLAAQVRPQLWLLPLGQEVDPSDALKEAQDALKRVRTPEALVSFMQSLLSLVRHLHGGLEDSLEALYRFRSHWHQIQEAELGWPVILSVEGKVMDGRHRIAKAILEGESTVRVQQFETNPEPRERLRFRTWADYQCGEYEVLT